MALIGFIFSVLFLLWLTVALVISQAWVMGFKGYTHRAMLILSISVILDLYLWYLLLSNSPFTLVMAQ